MKDKILHAIQSKVRIQKTRSLAGTIVNVLEGEEMAAEELTALMCYQIVKAYYLAYADFHGELSWESFTAEVEGHYLEEFDGNGELLRQAIEQVKKRE